ncbi:short chain dehydrogenase family protein, partial [Vibrio parahaemolyticus EKP-028]
KAIAFVLITELSKRPPTKL